ncbi:MAG: NfeD family protein [Pseudomonadota bacterium]
MEWLDNVSSTHWLGFGLLLLILEVSFGIAYLLGPGFAALIVALAVWQTELTPSEALVLFGVLSVITTWAYARYFRHSPDSGAADGLHDRTRSMIGKETTASDVIDGEARIAFGDTLWRVRSTGPAIAAGSRVRVEGVDDDVLLVNAVR